MARQKRRVIAATPTTARDGLDHCRMETIATYWEPIIRTYGFNLLEALVCSRITLPVDALGAWAEALERNQGPEASFRLLWFQGGLEATVTVFLLCDEAQWRKINSFWKARADDAMALKSTATSVDLLFFQGPHFGERHGILDYTLQLLARKRVPLKAAVCSVATVSLVVPAGWGARARASLEQAFETPKALRGARPWGSTAKGDGRP